MSKIKSVLQHIRNAFSSTSDQATSGISEHAPRISDMVYRGKSSIILLSAFALGAYALYQHPPIQEVKSDEIGIRLSRFGSDPLAFKEGMMLAIPGVHDVRRYSLRDMRYETNTNNVSFQSMEGLNLGIDFNVRYSLDQKRIRYLSRYLPENIEREIVEPQVLAVIHKTIAKHAVRDIFSAHRQAIQDNIETELKHRLEKDGIILRSITMGKVELPDDYRAKLESMLAQELETEKMKYTLDFKLKQVRQNELEAQADKVRRETAAEALANEQIIAAKAQAEAMKHVLPFKQKQIEQRQFEAEADKVTRIKQAEANSQARKIEAEGEAESRVKLADAEVYRLDKIGKSASEQLERDGATISKNPLLIQKAMADKLSDKVSVIIAAPPTDGGFIGANLLGGNKQFQTPVEPQRPMPTQYQQNEEEAE